jgi:putative selenate reductase
MKEIKNAAPASQSGTQSKGKTAIIGGGPAGLAAAYFLAKEGKSVTIFEKRSSLGGIVKHVIPEFRIGEAAIENDIALIKAMGAEIRLNSEVTNLDELSSEGFEQIIIATGAWKPGVMKLDGEAALNALDFMAQLKHDPESVALGENVAVIGGGNTAMDAARAAKTVSGVKKVSLVYRRTKRYMPADAEELAHALEDGVEFCELLQPVSLKNGILTCEQMELGAPDESGRRSPVSTGKKVEVPANTVITAVGDLADKELYEKLGIPTSKRGADVDQDTLETKLPNVYVIGDAVRGPATVAEAIADAIRCTKAITGLDTEKYVDMNVNSDTKPAMDKKGILHTDCSAVHESERCLECATICECCVDVCPNRANIAVNVSGRRQVVHVDFMCNECGNCEVFCPYSSAPYLDKFTYYACEEDFVNSENNGFLPLDDNKVRIRLEGKVTEQTNSTGLPEGVWDMIQAAMKKVPRISYTK